MTTEVKLYDAEKKPFVHVVEELSIFQLAKTLSTLKEIVGLARSNQSVAELVAMTAEAFEEDEAKKKKGTEKTTLSDPIEALQILLTEVPDKAVKLLSVMSGIDRDILEKQKAIVIFDVYDAIVEANDVKEFINRAKKSLQVTQMAMNLDAFNKNKKVQA